MDPNPECCVLGCQARRNQGLRFYQFPCHNYQITSIWEQRIGQSANIDFDMLNNLVCELHFDYRCKTGNECALEEGSLPTLHLPSFDNLPSTGNAHFEMSASRIEQPSYTISTDALPYHCRFCLRRGLLYEVEASTYRSKSFLSLIDLPLKVLPDNTQPNACLSCLKSIVIAHRLSMAVEHSNTILQQLLQHPKQSQLVSNTNFFDMKSELAFCNLIIADSLAIKLEIEECDNKDYEQKWVDTEDPTSPAAYVNTQNLVEKSMCVTENQDNVSKMHDSITSDKQCPKEFHKSFAIGAEYKTDFCADEILYARENSDSCVKIENTDDNTQVMVSDDSCAEDRKFDNEQVPGLTSDNLAIHKNLHLAGNAQRKSSTPTDENTHWNENDGVYVCPICDWKNPSLYAFNVHMGKHVESDANSTIGSEELETDPVRNIDGRYHCIECPKAFISKSNLDIHKRKHTNERPYKCTVCPKAFSDKSNFSRHKRIHTNERPYKCTECTKTFSTKSYLDIHKRIHTNERPYKCTECPKTFSQKGHFSVHKRIHMNERPYKCTECSKTFNMKVSLKRHKRIHTNEKPFKCTECPIAFISRIYLDLHKRIHINEKPYKCSECSLTFSQKSNFDTHKRIHTNERPYKCTECPKTFIDGNQFSRHRIIHTKEMPYKCTDCPKTFSSKSYLDKHKRIHTNERPYKCTECPKTFSQKGHFSVHMRTHTNERPYKCTECSKTFNIKSTLNMHKRIHTNEKPYKCTECPKAFISKCDFSRHKRIHTNERAYKCNLCPSAFNFSHHLKSHVLSKHSDRKT